MQLIATFIKVPSNYFVGIENSFTKWCHMSSAQHFIIVMPTKVVNLISTTVY